WTLIQQRTDGWLSFDKNWQPYRDGFGDSFNYWMGLEAIYQLTKGQNYRLQIQVLDFFGNLFIDIYETFYLGPESSNYPLFASGWIGYSGDVFNDPADPWRSTGDGIPFSTRDRDNDNSWLFCSYLINGGWWYNDCTKINLNGVYLIEPSFRYYFYFPPYYILPFKCRMLIQQR
ncbi:hypothetical protein HELRODRAFT_82245, partial [Helobdella robusta]|uniref:Fibrinogen C-terminal domain-containing protein n=1 Tax=Helobdella robusta TaxID=6412 RepID=T1G4P6_HELRO